MCLSIGRSLEFADHGLRRLGNSLRRRRDGGLGLLQRAGARLLGNLADVDALAVDVVPRAAEEEGDVVGEVEDGGDKGQAGEEEEDAVWELSVHAHKQRRLRRAHTEGELLPRRHHVDAQAQLKVVLLELQPLAQGGEGGHAGRYCRSVGIYTSGKSIRSLRFVVGRVKCREGDGG